jgi:hypothetical protein
VRGPDRQSCAKFASDVGEIGSEKRRGVMLFVVWRILPQNDDNSTQVNMED